MAGQNRSDNGLHLICSEPVSWRRSLSSRMVLDQNSLSQPTRPEEIEFVRRLHGMREGIIDIPPPLEPPFDIETMEPIRVPALFRRAQEEEGETLDSSHLVWQAPGLPLDDECILVLDGGPIPPDEFLGPAPDQEPGPFEESIATAKFSPSGLSEFDPECRVQERKL